MRVMICPKCGASYERHPLSQTHQELCPACRNKVSWDDIRAELAQASKLGISVQGRANTRSMPGRPVGGIFPPPDAFDT